MKTTRYLLQRGQESTREASTHWQATHHPPLLSCSALQRNLTANSELRLWYGEIYAASARAIMAAKHVQMCTKFWLNLQPTLH